MTPISKHNVAAWINKLFGVNADHNRVTVTPARVSFSGRQAVNGAVIAYYFPTLLKELPAPWTNMVHPDVKQDMLKRAVAEFGNRVVQIRVISKFFNGGIESVELTILK